MADPAEIARIERALDHGTIVAPAAAPVVWRDGIVDDLADLPF